MKKLLAPFFLLSLLVAFLAGCGGPNTTMVGLQVELAGIERAGEGNTSVSWRVVNPNVVAYLVGQAKHSVYLNGVLVGTIQDREALAVPAQNKAVRTSKLVIAGPDAERTLAAAAAAGSAAYKLESVVTIRLYGENTDKSDLRSTGTVLVTGK